MAHIISNSDILLDSNIKLDSIYCLYSPIFNNIDKGEISFELDYYKDKESFDNGYSKITPNSDTKYFVKKISENEKHYEDIMNIKFLSTSVSSYLENIYGFWKVKDDKFDDIYDFNIYNSEASFTIFNSEIPKHLYKIQITKLGGSLCGNINFNKASNSESLHLFSIDLSNGAIDNFYDSSGYIIKEDTDYYTIFNKEGFTKIEFNKGDTIDVTFSGNYDTAVNIKMKFRK